MAPTPDPAGIYLARKTMRAIDQSHEARNEDERESMQCMQMHERGRRRPVPAPARLFSRLGTGKPLNFWLGTLRSGRNYTRPSRIRAPCAVLCCAARGEGSSS